MKLWIDDVRQPPGGYIHYKTVNGAIFAILLYEKKNIPIEVIDIDHDAGEYAIGGGDYIKLLDWLEETGRNYPIRLHSQNPVGVQNMRAIIQHNGWKEIR